MDRAVYDFKVETADGTYSTLSSSMGFAEPTVTAIPLSHSEAALIWQPGGLREGRFDLKKDGTVIHTHAGELGGFHVISSFDPASDYTLTAFGSSGDDLASVPVDVDPPIQEGGQNNLGLDHNNDGVVDASDEDYELVAELGEGGDYPGHLLSVTSDINEGQNADLSDGVTDDDAAFTRKLSELRIEIDETYSWSTAQFKLDYTQIQDVLSATKDTEGLRIWSSNNPAASVDHEVVHSGTWYDVAHFAARDEHAFSVWVEALGPSQDILDLEITLSVRPDQASAPSPSGDTVFATAVAVRLVELSDVSNGLPNPSSLQSPELKVSSVVPRIALHGLETTGTAPTLTDIVFADANSDGEYELTGKLANFGFEVRSALADILPESGPDSYELWLNGNQLTDEFGNPNFPLTITDAGVDITPGEWRAPDYSENRDIAGPYSWKGGVSGLELPDLDLELRSNVLEVIVRDPNTGSVGSEAFAFDVDLPDTTGAFTTTVDLVVPPYGLSDDPFSTPDVLEIEVFKEGTTGSHVIGFRETGPRTDHYKALPIANAGPDYNDEGWIHAPGLATATGPITVTIHYPQLGFDEQEFEFQSVVPGSNMSDPLEPNPLFEEIIEFALANNQAFQNSPAEQITNQAPADKLYTYVTEIIAPTVLLEDLRLPNDNLTDRSLYLENGRGFLSNARDLNSVDAALLALLPGSTVSLNPQIQPEPAYLTNNNRLAAIADPTAEFTYGFLQGFFVDGLYGTVKGMVIDLPYLLGSNLHYQTVTLPFKTVQYTFETAFLNESRAFDAEIATATTAVEFTQFGAASIDALARLTYEITNGNIEVIGAIYADTHLDPNSPINQQLNQHLDDLSEEHREALRLGLLIINSINEFVDAQVDNALKPETMGYLTGLVLFEGITAFNIAGKAAKLSKVQHLKAFFLNSIDSLKANPRVGKLIEAWSKQFKNSDEFIRHLDIPFLGQKLDGTQVAFVEATLTAAVEKHLPNKSFKLIHTKTTEEFTNAYTELVTDADPSRILSTQGAVHANANTGVITLLLRPDSTNFTLFHEVAHLIDILTVYNAHTKKYDLGDNFSAFASSASITSETIAYHIMRRGYFSTTTGGFDAAEIQKLAWDDFSYDYAEFHIERFVLKTLTSEKPPLSRSGVKDAFNKIPDQSEAQRHKSAHMERLAEGSSLDKDLSDDALELYRSIIRVLVNEGEDV